MPRRKKATTPEDALERANRELHKIGRVFFPLCPAATADWPPAELKNLAQEIRDRFAVNPNCSGKLIREDWDFRVRFTPPRGTKCVPFTFLEDAEVLPCYEYETARAHSHWVADVTEWRESANAQTFTSLLDLWCHRWRANQRRPNNEFYVLWPEWPKVPYLRLPEKVRRERLRLWTGRAFRRVTESKRLVWEPRALDTVGFAHLFGYRGAFWKELPDYHGPYEDAIVGETITFSGERHPPWRWREFVAFDIHWEDSNDLLVSRFQAWVERRRREHGLVEQELRGPKSYTSELRTTLCALGAWRLLHERGSATGAFVHSQTVAGKALYANHASTWSEAKTRAEQNVYGLV